MKNVVKMTQKALTATLFALISLVATAQTSTVSNVRVQTMDHVLIIHYDLALRADIEVHASFDGGTTFTGPLQHLTGEAGRGIEPGANKMIVWNARNEFGQMDAPNTIIKVVSTNEDASSRVSTTSQKSNNIYLPPLFNYTKNASFQVGVMNFAENVRGVQLAPFFGYTNAADNVKGVQLNFINVAKEIRGLQMGAVNTAKKSNGSVHIGVVNVVDGKFIPIFWVGRKKN